MRKLVLVAAIALSAGSLAISGGQPVIVSVCDIVARPESYVGKLVKLATAVESDGMHSILLIDRACPERGIAPEFPDTEPMDPGRAALLEAIYGKGRPGTLDKKVAGVFTGTFELRSKETPCRILHVTEVSHLRSVLVSK